MKLPVLSIIIINYNTPVLVYDCINSLRRHLKCSYELIVVENASRDRSRIEKKELLKVLPDAAIQLVVSKKNLGFGRGNNLGARLARGKYLWFLNSDTLLEDDAASLLVDFLDNHPEVGAATPLLFHKEGDMQKNFFASFQTLGSITFRRYNDRKIDLSQEYFYTDIVIGAAMMIERKKFDQIGGFDKNIFMYLEDDDLCKRIESAGFKNVVLNTAKIVHLEGRSSNQKYRKQLYYRSQTYFWHKHNGLIPTILMRILRWPWKVYNTHQL